MQGRWTNVEDDGVSRFHPDGLSRLDLVDTGLQARAPWTDCTDSFIAKLCIVNIHVLSVPYDSGRRGFRLGRGPEHLIQHGLIERLSERGHRVELFDVLIDDSSVPSDIGSAIAIDRQVAERVRSAVSQKAFPLVLAGNCSTAVGTVAGIGSERAGVVWFDSHGDLNTPDTTTSGFLDGMALSMVAGRCWSGMTLSVPGWVPVPEDRIALIGARDFDPPEETFLRFSAMAHISPEAIRTQGVDAAVAPVLGDLANRVGGFYVHMDLDVVDPEEASVNEYQAPGGLDLEAVARAVHLTASYRPIVAAALTAYDPASGDDDRALRAALSLTDVLVDATARAGS